MNVVFKSPDGDSEKGHFLKVYTLDIVKSCWLLVILAGLFFLFFNILSDNESSFESRDSIELSLSQDPFQSVIDPVAESYGIPADYMRSLAGYINFNKDLFGGVGLFSVHPADLGWIQDRVLLETSVDLADDMQNAQVAAYLISRFHDSGYSWRESFLIYAFGFPAIHGSDHQDFVDFIGFN